MNYTPREVAEQEAYMLELVSGTLELCGFDIIRKKVETFFEEQHRLCTFFVKEVVVPAEELSRCLSNSLKHISAHNVSYKILQDKVVVTVKTY